MKKKIDLQHFAALPNLTGTGQITVSPREVDFVTSFSRSVQALIDIMGISRPVRKAPGTVLYSLQASGTLQDGNVAEGDEIPLSQFAVEPVAYDTINIEKWRKAVSIEAINNHGYDVAVQMTDEELKVMLQDDVMGRFYDYIKTGTLTSTETTFQMGVSMAIGQVKNKFKTMHKNSTGVAVFVNTLDLYRYLGAAPITIQTAFGMDYVENFLGADVVFISSEIDAGQIIATPLNNLVMYYVDPSDSEFSRAGLSYTTDSETGLIGFHTEGNYQRAQSEAFAIMGLTLFAEYLDGIAIVTVSP